jgi:hypothetical protein
MQVASINVAFAWCKLHKPPTPGMGVPNWDTSCETGFLFVTFL